MSDFLDLAGMSSLRGDARPEPADWNPDLYRRHAGPRLQPALDLMARIDAASPRSVVDLGCGTGGVTRILAERWPEAQVTGLDSSAAMLAKARAGTPVPGVTWLEADIASWRPEGELDVVYSNAALHWVADHASLFPRLVSTLAPGGTLAVQMPKSWDQPSHRLMRDVLDSGEIGPLGDAALRERMGRPPTLEPGDYLDLLQRPDRRVELWITEYVHVLEGEDPVLEWVTATGLRPVLDALGEPELGRFLAEYRRRLREAYPRRADGTTLFPFRRLFLRVTSTA